LQGIELFVIGIGGHTDIREITAIATSPKEKHIFTVDRFEEFTGLHTEILKTCGFCGTVI